MRAVCFVKRLQWDLPGTLFRHGLTIGDVDNDGDNELVVGTAEGDLYIFKVLYKILLLAFCVHVRWTNRMTFHYRVWSYGKK